MRSAYESENYHIIINSSKIFKSEAQNILQTMADFKSEILLILLIILSCSLFWNKHFKRHIIKAHIQPNVHKHTYLNIGALANRHRNPPKHDHTNTHTHRQTLKKTLVLLVHPFPEYEHQSIGPILPIVVNVVLFIGSAAAPTAAHRWFNNQILAEGW